MSLETLIKDIDYESPEVILSEYFRLRNNYINKIISSNTFYGEAEKQFNKTAIKFMVTILDKEEYVNIINQNKEYLDTVYWDIKSLIRVKAMIVSMGVYISFIGEFYGESYLRVKEYISFMREFKQKEYAKKVHPDIIKKLCDLFCDFDKLASTHERTRVKYNYYMSINKDISIKIINSMNVFE